MHNYSFPSVSRYFSVKKIHGFLIGDELIFVQIFLGWVKVSTQNGNLETSINPQCAAYIGIGGMKIEDEPRH
jgi:hypothetical protein